MVCPCCACVCDKTVTYSYYDSEPPGKFYAECPNIGACDGTSTGDCAGEILEGFIVERFRKSCVGTKTIRAKLLAGSTVDDYGTIGGVSTTNVCGVLGSIAGDHDVTDEVVIEDDGDFIKAKIPISITNDEYLGGPHGLSSVTICWCCEEEDASGCACFPPPPGCCCLAGGVGYYDDSGSCEGTEFPIPATYDYTDLLSSLVMEWCGLTINGPGGFDAEAIDVVECDIPTAGTEHEGRTAYLRSTTKQFSAYSAFADERPCHLHYIFVMAGSKVANVQIVLPEFPGFEPVWRYANVTDYYSATVRVCNNGDEPTITVDLPVGPLDFTNECGQPARTSTGGVYGDCYELLPVITYVPAP